MSLDERFDEKFLYKNVGYQPEGYSILLDKTDGYPISDRIIKDFVNQELTDYQNQVIKCLEEMKKLEAHPPIPQIRGDSYRMGYNKCLEEAIAKIKQLK